MSESPMYRCRCHDNATREDVGIAFLKKNSKRGSNRRTWKGGRDGVASKRVEDREKGRSLGSKSPKCLNRERNEGEVSGSGKRGVASDLAGLSLFGRAETRSGRER